MSKYRRPKKTKPFTNKVERVNWKMIRNGIRPDRSAIVKINPLDWTLEQSRGKRTIPLRDEPSFFDLTKKTEIYCFMRQYLEELIENNEGDIPRNFIDKFVEECKKCIIMILLDNYGKKTQVVNIMGRHKYAVDRDMMDMDIYDYYSTEHSVDVEV